MQRIIQNWKNNSELMTPTGIFKSNGTGRRYFSFQESELRQEAFSAFGITELFKEPMFDNFIGEHYLDGACTHLHKDPALQGFIHVRVNWMLNKPFIGGNPILDGKELQVNQNDLWICFASEETHGSTPIKGGIRRICSFGALIKRPEDFNIKGLFI